MYCRKNNFERSLRVEVSFTQTHREDRVLGIFSSRPNWLGPPIPPPPLVPGGPTHLREKKCGVPFQTRGQTMWYSRYIIVHVHCAQTAPLVTCLFSPFFFSLTLWQVAFSCVCVGRLGSLRFSALSFFHESAFPGPLSIPLGPFQFFVANSRRYSQMNVYQWCQQHQR